MLINLPTIGEQEICFYSYSDLLLARGYVRVEYGKRGPYIEFEREHINIDSFYIPIHEKWRINSESAYYIEFRSRCNSYVKLYLQKKLVSYAKYEIDKFYISPYDLKSDKYGDCTGTASTINLFF